MGLWETGRALWALRRETRRGLPRARIDALLQEIDRSPSLPLRVAPAVVLNSLRRLRRFTADEDTCLVRSIAAYATLRRLGHAPHFVIGVENDAMELRAHAWVEVDGLDSDPFAHRFTPIFRHPQ